MKILKEYKSEKLDEESKALGYCYKVITDDGNEYLYEITKNNNVGYIKYENLDYIEAVIEEFRKAYEYVNIFKSYDDTFYEEFENVSSFKLPIDIIQVTELLINKDRLDILEESIDPNNIHLSVKIINDEYVLIGDHTILYTLKLIGERMVNVFINTTIDSNTINSLKEFIYVLKENNVTSIAKCTVYDELEYFMQAKMYNQLLNVF